MKRMIKAGCAGFFLAVTPVWADLTSLTPGYGLTEYYGHTNSDVIVSYDWDGSGNLYYQASTAFYNFGGLYSSNGVSTTEVVAGNSDFSGASVVRVGNFIYYNTNDFTEQKIYRYGPTTGSPTLTLASTASNYSLHSVNGGLYLTGAPGFGTNHIYSSGIDSNGALLNDPPIDLGETFGGSGPLAFDAVGNMYYAPGFGDLTIYKWAAADVAAALSGTALPQGSEQIWRDYGTDFSSVSGGTSMVFDAEGDLWLSLTSFSDSSLVVEFDVDGSGDYAGAEALFSTTDRLGELRQKDGAIYLSNDNKIYQVVPEPGTYALMALGLCLLVGARFRRFA
jgi:hypothetical protein